MTTRKAPVLKNPQISVATSLKSIRDWMARIDGSLVCISEQLALAAESKVHDYTVGELRKAEQQHYADIMAVLTGIRADQDSELRKANQQLLGKIAEQAKYIHELEGWRDEWANERHFSAMAAISAGGSS